MYKSPIIVLKDKDKILHPATMLIASCHLALYILPGCIQHPATLQNLFLI